tara:strand:+ start:366 stop:1052 length:687 start_codon:yes stop_codon:yes gene_type:complete
MQKTIIVSGMTCQKCENYIIEKISSLPGVTDVTVKLKEGKVLVLSERNIIEQNIQDVIGDKYMIKYDSDIIKLEKLKALKPLFLIFIYLIFGTYYLNMHNLSLNKVMIDFMGLFFIVFSFFKFLDYSTFPKSFSKYDPIAVKSKLYARLYPFIELLLGLCFLFNFKIKIISFITLSILSITTIGITKSLVKKNQIECACLGTSMKLPMTEATLIENLIMILMSLNLLI